MYLKTILFGCLLGLPGMLAAQQQYESAVRQALQTYLAGETPQLEALDMPLKPNQVEAYQQMVWKIWRESLPQDFQEITSLDTNIPGFYDIPDSLEPKARMNYYLGFKGEKPAAGYPFYMYLHGSGPSEQEWDSGFKINNKNEDAPSVCFIPKIPNEGAWYRWWQRSKQHVWERLIRQEMANEELNPDQFYFWGISEGGYGSQRLASFYADYLAGAGPIACGEPLINAPSENCANIAFAMTTGQQDFAWARITFSTITKERFDELEKAHPGLYRHRILLVPGMGHFVDYYSTTPWLHQFTRNPYPHYVCWEDYAMDGRHRSGFYNLVPLDSIGTEDRRMYEMQIEGNTIRLTVSDVAYHSEETAPQWNNITTRYSKTLTPVPSGHLRICLCDQLLKTKKTVRILVNGKEVFKGKPVLNLRDIVDNCIRFYDPRRLYPTSVDVTW